MTTRASSRSRRLSAAVALGAILLFNFGRGPLAADMPTGSAPAADLQMRRQIDAILKKAWRDASVVPASPADDAEFLRRAYLDLTGRIPRVSEARTFLEERNADKRAALIDNLLDHPGYASHMAEVWREFLLPETASAMDVGISDAFESWLRQRFAENRSYAQMVRELILATGQPDEAGPALFYTSLELKPEKLAASTSRALLGIQIQCAECHNHPFDKWTKQDFWGYAAFFARVAPETGNGMRGLVAVSDRSVGEVTLPNSHDPVRPRYPLGNVAPDESGRTRRMLLADWMTSPSNPYFAKAAVNRVWAQFFGRGIVDPPDDMRADRPAQPAGLLEELAAYFARANYDLRRLIRVLATTEAYQLASEECGAGRRPPDVFAAMQLKVLTAEQLYHCMAIATCRPYDKILASVPSSVARRVLTNRNGFVNSFRAPPGGPTEYLAGIPQALMLLNGRLVNDSTDFKNSDMLRALDAPFLSDRERVETLFLATLCRMPSKAIRDKFEAHVSAQATPEQKRRALGNILWALLNSAEFAVNH